MKLVSILVAIGMVATANAQTVRVGVFDKPSVVLAFYRSPQWNTVMKAKLAEREAAQRAGDSAKVQQLEAWGKAQQELAHHQLAGEAPITNILEALAPQLPELAHTAGVNLIATDLAYCGPGVQVVDLTELLLDTLQADTRTRSLARDLQKPGQ